MTVRGRRSAPSPPDRSPEDLPAGKRQAPDYVPPPPAPVSWEDFLAWLDEGVHAEWVDGEIVEMPPTIDEHQWVLGFLYRLTMDFVEERELGAVYLAPFLMRLPQKPSGREPDLLFVSADHAARATRTCIDGPADLVVEIVSPESMQRDRRVKLAEYQAAGIPEYWLIDLPRRTATFYRLGDDGRYRPDPIDADGIYTSRVLAGFRLRVSWLWQRPLPTLASALADLTE
jgi:Uma2 family endonuclease